MSRITFRDISATVIPWGLQTVCVHVRCIELGGRKARSFCLISNFSVECEIVSSGGNGEGREEEWRTFE